MSISGSTTCITQDSRAYGEAIDRPYCYNSNSQSVGADLSGARIASHAKTLGSPQAYRAGERSFANDYKMDHVLDLAEGQITITQI
jgi:hypothetical protein